MCIWGIVSQSNLCWTIQTVILLLFDRNVLNECQFTEINFKFDKLCVKCHEKCNFTKKIIVLHLSCLFFALCICLTFVCLSEWSSSLNFCMISLAIFSLLFVTESCAINGKQLLVCALSFVTVFDLGIFIWL